MGRKLYHRTKKFASKQSIADFTRKGFLDRHAVPCAAELDVVT